MALMPILVKHLNGNRQRFQPDPDIFINIAFVNRAKATFAKHIVRSEALGDGLQFKQGEGNHIGVNRDILGIFYISRGRRVTDVREGTSVLLIMYLKHVELLHCPSFERGNY